MYIEEYENTTGKIETIGLISAFPFARIRKSIIDGPLQLNRNSQVGPDAVVGRYTSFSESTFFVRGTIGSFCAVGNRCCLNAANHPTSWLSIHGFQYHHAAFAHIDEYNTLRGQLPWPTKTVTIGNDVWIGNQVNIMAGVVIGDGAVIGAGAVVTNDVPPYAVVAGVPARILRLRFPRKTIKRLLELKWWALPLAYLDGLPFNDVETCIDQLQRKADTLREKMASFT